MSFFLFSFGSFGLAQAGGRHLEFDAGIDEIAVSAEPGRVGGQGGIGRDDAGLIANGSRTQVLLGRCQVGLGHLQLLLRLTEELALLGHLQVDELAGVVQLVGVEASLGLGLLILVNSLSRSEPAFLIARYSP